MVKCKICKVDSIWLYAFSCVGFSTHSGEVEVNESLIYLVNWKNG